MGALIPAIPPIVSWSTLVAQVPTDAASFLGLIGPWRPPQWRGPQPYSLTVREITTTAASHNITFLGQVTQSTVLNPNIRQSPQDRTYFFDAVLRAEHRQDLRRTEHPIQSGASIVDHAYMLPARISLEIGMSDCMAQLVAGQWTGADSKSVSAFQTLKIIQKKRLPLTLSTRLERYDNMLIESIAAIENYQTKHALRAQVVFSQIIIASLATQTASARPDATDVTNEGTKQPLPPAPGMFTPTTEQALSGFE